jgi:CheY-like chemotaxis protein
MATRLLVVDDDPLVREAVRTMLRFDGHEVHLAAGPEEALGLFEPGKFAVVIVDYTMPGMSGAQLAVAIKERDPSQPVLMITAYKEALGETPKGVDLILGKPFRFEALRAAVASLLPPSSSSPEDSG